MEMMPMPMRDNDNIRNSMDDKDSGKDSETDDQADIKALDGNSPQDGKGPKSPKELTPQKAASPLVIQWLQDNYEAAEGTSLPRSTLYTHYVSFCGSMNIEPVNAASFGKLIRSIFPNLKTRRLGTRGHSKYHYYGIRIKATSELRLPTFSSPSAMMSANKPKNRIKSDFEQEKLGGRPEDAQSLYEINGHGITTGASHVALPEFVLPENFSLPAEVGQQGVELAHTFMITYKQHCQNLIDSVFRHHFLDVDKLLQQFWQTLVGQAQFRLLLSTPDFIEQIAEKDQLTYKAMATVLLPNVLQALPVSIPQAIRQFAKQLEQWLATALEGLPSNLVTKKMNVAKKFSQSLHKQASLNHLTQAARAVLQNTTQVSQMIIDWNRLDFEFIRDQASWICQCGEEFIQSAQEDFKRFLTERATLEQWAQWLQDIVTKILGKCTDPRELVLLSQQLLLKWSFYSTLIIRDLTIRNASSFGSFHLLRTLFDEYIFYLVETKFASLVHAPQVPATATPALQQNYEQTPNHSVEAFSLDSLLNKENGRGAKHLPYPFQVDGNSEKSNSTPIASEEDYSRLDMLQHPELMHLNVQPYQQQFQASRNSFPNQYVQQAKPIEGMHINQMASAQQMMRGNVIPADHTKRPAPEMMKSAHIVYNFSQPQMNYHQVDPQTMQRQYSYDMQAATAMHFPNANDQNKKMRIEVHDS
jgi:regulatory factor X 1/2/3